MRKKFLFILLALAMSCSLVLAVACEEKGGETPAPGPDDESVVYEGDMLYNGFEDQGDLYRIKQLFDWDYTPLGKLEIVGADNFLMREDASEEQAAADAVSAMIAQLPAADTVTAFSLSLKQQITAARCAYGALSDAAKRLVVGLDAFEALEANDALAGVYTLADLGGDFMEDIPAATPWLGYRAPLADPMRGTVVFRAGGFAETDGAFYISLFHEGNTSNAGDGIMLYLRNFTEANGTPRYELRPQNSTDEGIPFEDENGDPVKLSASETYTFTLGYEVEEDFSALTFSVRMEDAAGNVVAEGSQTVDSFTLATAKGETFPYDAAQTVESWLGGEGALAAHANLFLDAGNSTGVHIESAWQVPAASDYAEPSEEADPHDPADLSPRQGEGALRVYYEQGSFTQILARFDDSALSGLPVEELGGFSVRIYNDSAAERQVTLALMREQNVPMVVEGGDLTLAPYAWTECKVTFNPYIVDALADELIGLTLLFDETQESVYYVDDWRVQFGQTHTPEQEELMGEASSLVEDIAAQLGDRVTVDDKEMLEALYARYLALPEEWHPLITNSADLFEAIDDYLYARAGSGSSGTDALIFEEVFGLRQLGSVTGAAASYSEEEHPAGAEGSLRLDFDGTTDWTYVPVTPVMGLEYDEVHIWVNNVSDKARAFYINWQMADAAYGACVTGGNVQNGYVIPANSGWVELVYRSNTFAITELEMVTLNANNAATASEGTLYIGNVTLTGAVPAVIGAIDALADYEAGYSDADKAAVAAARAAYDALTEQQKAQVTNIAKLVSLEADIWREGFAALPATPAEMTEYTKEYAAAVEGLQTAYAALDEAVQALVAEEHALLAEFAARLEALFAELAAENVTGMIDALAEYSAAYTDADRAAVAAACAAYDALSAEDKAEVSNAAKLFALEADIWREGFAALPAVEEMHAYEAEYAVWKQAVAALREGYAALDASVHAGVAEERTLLEAYEAKAAEEDALLAAIAELDEDITAIAVPVTAASRDALEALYARLNGFAEAYRGLVTQQSALFAAIDAYFAAVTVPNAEGETTVLHFDQPLGETQVNAIVIGNARLGYAEESPDGVGGSLRVDYDGTATEVDLPVGAIAAAGYEEVRVWVKNDSDAKRGVWLLNGGAWVTAKAAYGEGVEDGNIVGGFVIPAESGWIELVYDASVFTDGLTGFATGSLDEGNAIVASVGTLYIGRVTLVSASDAVETMIASLAAYAPGYPDADKAAVAAARAAYDALTEQQKVQVGNVAKLVSLEADIWREGFAALPASPDEMTDYKAEYAVAIEALRQAYAKLDAAVQEAVADDHALLEALDAKLAQLLIEQGAEIVAAQIDALAEYSDAYTDTDRAAVAAARAAYDALSAEDKAEVSNAAKLFALEADIWREGFAALPAVEELNAYSENWAAWQAAVAALREGYAALDASVHASVAEDRALLEAYEAKVAELSALLGEIGDLNEDIAALAGEAITEASRDLLEGLYARYTALGEDYRAMVTDYAALASAVRSYLALVTVPNAEGETTVLHFDQPLGETQVNPIVVGNARLGYAEESPDGVGGSLRVDYDGTATEVDLPVDAIAAAGYEEVRVWVKNDSDAKRGVWLLNGGAWVTAKAAYGEGVEDGNLVGGFVIPAESGWIELVYDASVFTDGLTGFATGSLDEGNGLTTSVGTLYIGRVIFVSYADRVEGQIAALADYAEGYSQENKAAVAAARAAYDALTEQQKVQVGNVAKLVSLEADIWREGFAALPALDAFGEYSEAAEQAIRALRTGYAALDPAVQEAVREDEARLAAYEARLEELIAARRVEYFKELVAALKAYSADYTEEDRAAVAAARAQYVQLTQEQQAQVAEEAAKLFALEADLFAGDVAALEAALDGAVYSAALEESVVSLRAAYAALDASVLAEEDVVAAEATLQACEKTLAQLKADHEAALEEVEALVSEIAAVGTVTAESKGTLEDLYSRYNALPEAYRGSVTNYAALQTAIAQYLAAVTVPNENGETTVLHFDELLGETQWKVSAGADLLNTSYSATESAQQIDFMSAARIDANLDFVPAVSLEGYDEVHLWVRNTTQRQMFIYLDWKGSDAAYGDTVVGGNLSAGGYLIDGNAWTEVVYKVPKFYNEATGLTQLVQLNLAAIATENGLSGSLFVGKMVLVDYSEKLNGMVDALPEGDLGSYTLAQIKQIKQAQEAYETLTAEEKTAFDATDRGEKLAACISAVANYCTLSDLTATTSGYYGTKNLATGNAVTIGSWDYAAAALPSFADTRSATIVFKASGLAAMDGAMYISLFHDGSANAGQASDGVTFQLNAGSVQSLTTGGGSYNNESGMTVSTAETYTFYVGYTIAENYSSVTINIRIVASDGSVLVTFEHKAETIAPFSTGQGVVEGVNYGTVDLGGSQTIAAWLSTHANTANHQTLYLNGGNSSSVTVSDAW